MCLSHSIWNTILICFEQIINTVWKIIILYCLTVASIKINCLQIILSIRNRSFGIAEQSNIISCSWNSLSILFIRFRRLQIINLPCFRVHIN